MATENVQFINNISSNSTAQSTATHSHDRGGPSHDHGGEHGHTHEHLDNAGEHDNSYTSLDL
jgi:urease accessory protein